MASRRDLLLLERRRVLEELRAKAPDLVRELEAFDMALEKMGEDPPPSDDYVKYGDNAMKAIQAYFEKQVRTKDREEVLQTILDGRFNLDNPSRRESNLRGSITYHLNHSETTKVIKRFRSGRIGAYSWTKDYDQR